MYTFIPRLPTKTAWDNRAFNDMPSLTHVIQAMREKGRYFYGEILFRPDEKKWVEFKTVHGLEATLTEIEENTISRIYIHEIGYFRNTR